LIFTREIGEIGDLLMSALSDALQGSLPGSDPSQPNSFIQTPQQVAYQQALAQELMRSGSSTAPIASPWAGVAHLVDALNGANQSYQANRAQRLGQANATADQSNVFNQRGMLNDPSEANIPATPGQTTPALQANDAANDAVTDAADNGVNPRAALLAALNGGAAPAPAQNAATLAAAINGGPVAPASGNGGLATAINGGPMAPVPQVTSSPLPPPNSPLTAAAGLGAGTPYGTSNVNGAGAPSPQAALNPNARGMRNNNPGNLEANAYTQAMPGYVGTDGRFAIFSTPQAGQAALDRNLQNYGAKGIATPLAIASTWAPGSEAANNPNSYGAVIAKALGVGPNDPVNMSDPATRAKIGQAIALVENGPAPSASSPAAAAISAAAAGGSGQQPPSGPGVAPQTMVAPAPSPAPGMPAPGQMQGGDISGLLRVADNPWTGPASRQLAEGIIQAQMPTPGTFGVIGKDPNTGNDQYGFINPKTQTVTPANGGAAQDGGGPLAPLTGAPASSGPTPAATAAQTGAAKPQATTVADALANAAPNGMTSQGAAYLDAMEKLGGSNADVARNARAIIDGQLTMPDGFAATKPIDIAIRNAVLRAAPGFNQALAGARADMVKQFASHDNSGSAGNIIDASQKGLHHLNALADTAAQLAPGDYTLLNHAQQVGQEYLAAGGNPALKAFDINRRALTDELTKLYKGGVASEGEVNGMLGDLQAAQTPAEMKAVFGKIGTLLTGVTDTYQNRWQSAFGPNSVYPIMQPENAGVLKRFQDAAPSPPSGAASQTPPSAAGPRTPPPAPDARQAPDGNWYRPDPARPGKYLKAS
jgi:hypothetical protein